MIRERFLERPDIQGFVEWLTTDLESRIFHLKLPSTRFVRGGLDIRLQGIAKAQENYQWEGDWTSVSAKLLTLRTDLRQAAGNGGTQAATYDACRAILKWGNVENKWSVDFLEDLRDREDLVGYLNRMKPLLALNGTQSICDLNPKSVLKFNSGLTKIHALMDTTGSPIYDGRVGAAAAMLYHLYRASHQAKGAANHDQFGWGEGQSYTLRDPKYLKYLGTPELKTKDGDIWAQRQLKLGWIIQAVLTMNKGLFPGLPMADRCHALEAGLFMVGYDLRAVINGWHIPDPPDLVKKQLRAKAHAAAWRKRKASAPA
ncbi:hypothetical protein [Pseudomonas sp. HY7a-MNA-CIBAN-0227]|uniref:hypothetical protein n=1 Tax=Pseudomonas sp. HY7a-MNA-CIBAN-0227 TaxID=3140474 RepID=UPI0033220505